jgi:hypothetical protein
MFYFWLIVSVLSVGSGGGRLPLPVDIASIFGDFEGLSCANGVLASLNIVYIFLSFSEYICYLYMGFHIFYL